MAMMTSLWSSVADSDEAVLTMGIPLRLTAASYFGFGLLFLALDCSGAARWWQGVKCQPRREMPWTDVAHIVASVTAQLASVYPLALWLMAPLMRGRLSFDAELPSTAVAAASLAFFAVATEVYFYHVHRALHHPRVYPYVHKVHHRYTAPVALECLYFHPVESMLQLGTVAFGPLLLGSHVALLYLWIVIVMFNISLHHCGHEVPCDEVPPFGSMTHQHDYHHKVFNANFGVVGVCDWLYGTRGGYDDYHASWEAGRRRKERESGVEDRRGLVVASLSPRRPLGVRTLAS